ncbi:MFS transporter (macronuclear) [Tetrahymena thermophila SB210]|uniref:MFS transporter n=1 Tax=Tetrahymena thermophila (strain SB210) TaxID=312017 RepID=W7XCJ4_TETTS|nr:MFS transporter [Tetrahymena thermophila SB210]EWS71491.1 MFS transporter [Tetrahymena thermophila SB210]|eukprot:XP_012655974.1 MFS transporter [Tetrahymena thermophila SB210]
MRDNSETTEIYKNEQSSSSQEMDIDEAMEKVGQRHKYQKVIVFFSSLTMFFATFCYMVIPYYLSPPTFECLKDGKWTTCDEDNGACDAKIQSRMTTNVDSSISAQLELYCDNRTWRTIIQSTPYFGCIVGVFIFNYFSDNKGRAITIKVCWVIGTVFSLILNFSTNIPMLLIGSFGLGFGIQTLLSLVIVNCNEISAGQFRVIAVILLYVLWAVNEMQYIWLLKVFPNWKWCTFICFTAPMCLLTAFPFIFIRDSPRYLYQKSRQKCLEALNYIADFNKREKIREYDLKEEGRNDDRTYSYIDLFRYKSQRKTTIFMMILFISPHILYYGIQVSLDQLGSSFEENSLYIGIGEFIGYVASDLISHKIPRKKGTFYSLLVTCALCISFIFFQIPESCKSSDQTCWQKPFQSFMAALSRCIVSLTFSLMVLLCGETYPTTLKSVGYGFNFAIGMIGSFLSPYIVDISNRMGIVPVASLGVLTLMGCVAVCFLKETLNQPMLQEIPELQIRASSRKSLVIDINNIHSNVQEDENASDVKQEKIIHIN